MGKYAEGEYHQNGIRAALLMSGKMDFKVKSVKKYKKEYF